MILVVIVVCSLSSDYYALLPTCLWFQSARTEKEETIPVLRLCHYERSIDRLMINE
jgi:hypothetical protein